MNILIYFSAFILIALNGCTPQTQAQQQQQSKDVLFIAKTIAKNVYDGDTITDVEIPILNCQHAGDVNHTWPGVKFTDTGIAIVTDIRINGIDTPEIRVSRSLSEAERQRLKNLAYKSKEALIDILKKSEWQFYVHRPKFGKYAGRIIADIYVKRDGKMLLVSDLMIKGRFAKLYTGEGKRPKW